jgi:hypothetical protein
VNLTHLHLFSREEFIADTFINFSESMAPSSALPIGATRTVNEMQPIPLDPASHGSGLLNAIVALLAPPVHAEETERYDEEVLDLPASGFLAMFVSLLFLSFFIILIEYKELTSTFPIGSSQSFHPVPERSRGEPLL